MIFFFFFLSSSLPKTAKVLEIVRRDEQLAAETDLIWSKVAA